MKILTNVLSEETLHACYTQVNSTLRENKWAVSTFFWGPDVVQGVMAGTVTQVIEGELHERIKGEVGKYFPGASKLTMQFYMWPTGAGISWHNDELNGRTGAGTIYLNEEWHPNNGGLFIWEDKKTLELRALCPKKNTMVLNTEFENHMVTLVTPAATQSRLTIQVWGQH